MGFIYVSCMYAHMRTIACMHMCMNNSLVFVECYFYCRCIWRCILRFIRTLYAAYLIYRVVSFVVIIIYTQLSLCLCLSICYLSARTCTSVFCVYHGLFSLSYNSQKKKIKFSSLKKPLIFMPWSRTSLSQNRAFAVVGPALWNDSPPALRSVMLQGISSASLRSLKPFIFTSQSR